MTKSLFWYDAAAFSRQHCPIGWSIVVSFTTHCCLLSLINIQLNQYLFTLGYFGYFHYTVLKELKLKLVYILGFSTWNTLRSANHWQCILALIPYILWLLSLIHDWSIIMQETWMKQDNWNTKKLRLQIKWSTHQLWCEDKSCHRVKEATRSYTITIRSEIS